MNVFIFTGLLISLIDNNMADKRAKKRIVNGQDVQLFDVPSQVALMMRDEDGYFDKRCGAVLVAWNKILTAAHCVKGVDLSDLRAVVGLLNYYGPLTGYEQVVPFSKSNMYEDHWIIQGMEIYDIAVLTLATPVRPNKNVEVVKLADEIDSYVNTSCIVSGWGYNNKSLGTHPNRLQKAITMLISSTDCKKFWPEFADALDEEFFLCVYNKKGTSGQPNSICSGDSGGPLYCGPNKDILVGTAVGNDVDCSGMLPQVFTNVAAYKDWLADKL
ncbi:fibrinolytic enzyme, isozyme C-like [Biomphalaria glabrata]|uniref:Fibrinolytic enzyme, isozyme C-like n=1 Tax=Biomphalaria glabrata TaxID=6526 RepID=A0A9W2ZIJ5_BIOGL|nr:fibrinolytic enzyme, isozyme C-like [Biomphalaria glabrata]